MTWTTEPPTAEGYYLWRLAPERFPTLLKVSRPVGLTRFYATYQIGWVGEPVSQYKGGEWAGPIVVREQEPLTDESVNAFRQLREYGKELRGEKGSDE